MRDNLEESKVLALERDWWDPNNMEEALQGTVGRYYAKNSPGYEHKHNQQAKDLAMQLLWWDIVYATTYYDSFKVMAHAFTTEIYDMLNHWQRVPRSMVWNIGFEVCYAHGECDRLVRGDMQDILQANRISFLSTKEKKMLLEKYITQTYFTHGEKADLRGYGQYIIKDTIEKLVNKVAKLKVDNNIKLAIVMNSLINTEEIEDKYFKINITTGYHYTAWEMIGKIRKANSEDWANYVKLQTGIDIRDK